MSNNSNEQKWIEWMRRLPDWVKATISLAVALFGIVVAFRADYHLGIVVLGVIVLVSLLLFSIYIAFAKTPPLIEGGKGIYRYGQYRRVAIICILAIIFVTFFLATYRQSQSFIMTAFSGTATPSPTSESKLTIPQILISETDSMYRIEATINNPFKQEILIKGISLYTSEDEHVMCLPTPGPPASYQLSDLFSVKSSGESNLVFQGTVVNLSDSDFRYKVNGESYYGCGTHNLNLEFDTSFILPSQSFSQFYLLFPREMQLLDGTEKARIYFISSYNCGRSYVDIKIELHMLTDKSGEIVVNIPAEKFCNLK